jgi:hypothetical protein
MGINGLVLTELNMYVQHILSSFQPSRVSYGVTLLLVLVPNGL